MYWSGWPLLWCWWQNLSWVVHCHPKRLPSQWWLLFQVCSFSSSEQCLILGYIWNLCSHNLELNPFLCVSTGCIMAGIGDLSFEWSGYSAAFISCALQSTYLLLVERSGSEKGELYELLLPATAMWLSHTSYLIPSWMVSNAIQVVTSVVLKRICWESRSPQQVGLSILQTLVAAWMRILLTFSISYVSWEIANSMTKYSHYFWKHDRNSGCRFLFDCLGCMLSRLLYINV